MRMGPLCRLMWRNSRPVSRCTLCDLANRHAKLEQILLDDVRVSEQLLDLEKSDSSPLPLLHSALVANSLLLIPRFVSARVPDLVHVLLSHPKIEIFMDVAFHAVCMTISYFTLRANRRYFGSVYLEIRCGAESISYLDEVASCPESLALAKSVILEVLKVIKAVFGIDSRNVAAKPENSYQTGLLHLNAMRLTDIFSDDSNFQSYIMTYFTEVLSDVFSLSHGDFLSFWSSSDLPSREEVASLDYDLFAAAGWILDAFSSSAA
ncbi:hypothetical protein MLD38_018961 [Melastoma candidum]|uniref:Uncharacterized protein n=1 Tax=Melastoma candidum TaxID=119954 RepID=A0ACB9QVJ5_9MYRT|nr:hypothetical protein MLD38_018961 [Melastoma candidum]